MSIFSWLTSLTATTGLLGLAVWLGREGIQARLTRSIQHEFDRKLAVLRSDLTASEERLKASLREREAEIAALRSGALSSLASRQVAMDKRRLEAVDQIWAAFCSLAGAQRIATTMATINFEAAAKEAERNARAQKFFEEIGAGYDAKQIDQQSANKARPFLSPMAWAIFSAYQAVVMHSVIQWHVLKSGLGPRDFVNHEAARKLILAVLPGSKDYLDRVGSAGHYYCLETLESRLLEELQTMLKGGEFDKATLEQAAEIMRQANALQASDARSAADTISGSPKFD